jgi:hypothetical protein
MKKSIVLSSIVAMSVGLSACDLSKESARGFSLPEGNAEAGEQAFVSYGCINCHKVEGVTAPANHKYLLAKPVQLGGPSSLVRSYGELVTSIINPSHKLSPRVPVSQSSIGQQSKMANLNDELVVTDLVNLVTFLQPKFNVKPDRLSQYRRYELRQPTKE